MPTTKTITFDYKKVGDKSYRPIIPIEVEVSESVRYEVLVDSGADFCMFNAEIAEAIGIDSLESGEKFIFSGVTGKEEVGYMHEITIKVGDCTYQTKVAFSDSITDEGYGIVGQKGFFDRFAVKFDYAKKSITLTKKAWA